MTHQSLEIDIPTWLSSRDDYVLVDVRRPDEYEKASISGCLFAPLGEAFVTFLENADPEKVYVFVCARGSRSLQAAQLAHELREIQGLSLKGGIQLWLSQGLPVESSVFSASLS